MKSKVLNATIFALLAAGTTSTASACTRVVWDTAEHGTFVTRTMDWLEATSPTLRNIPRGTEYSGHLEFNVSQTSKYDVTGITTYGMITNGVNNEGLSGNTLFDDNMDAAKASSFDDIGVATYLTHILSQFANVSDVVKFVQASPAVSESVPGVPTDITLHYSFQDVRGDSAIVEFRDGEARIWHGSEYNVMTNQPDFDVHLTNIERSQRGWGNKDSQSSQTRLMTGGNINAEDRFIHASYFARHLKEPTSVRNGVVKLDGVPFKIPHDAPNRPLNGVMLGYATEYTVTEHLQSGETMVRYQWGDTASQFTYNVKQIQNSGKSLDFSIDTDGLHGDITQVVVNSVN
ncbi:linear amide C-N hydrolase [Vibrio aestuarianus]|uniref:linear amide C-N hydrolase n=1 Tax=Vibrio aestuarianus TaxID=28171 RepID=UPI00155904FF|nr:linear amide C-N hydrolase [Vibrio aestuarianus]NGZ15259.1 linear amide C-N hydrolase [Vibrio aestuarianus]NKZ51407.1 linear amide C-N hydrolase [Vibrio aestuarianus]